MPAVEPLVVVAPISSESLRDHYGNPLRELIDELADEPGAQTYVLASSA
jgi:hypothetical protein